MLLKQNIFQEYNGNLNYSIFYLYNDKKVFQ